MDLQEKIKPDLGTSCSIRYLFSECCVLTYSLRLMEQVFYCRLLCKIVVYLFSHENPRKPQEFFDRVLGTVIGLEKLG